MLKFEAFETERLLIRPHTMDDIEACYQVNLDPKVSEFTGDGGVKTRETIARLISENVIGDYQKHGFGRFAVIHKANNQLIGFSGLKYLEDLDLVDLGYRFHSNYWGQGIATEANKPFIKIGFELLGLKEIKGFVLPPNLASARVLKKLGFNFQNQFIEDGELVDCYSIQNANKTDSPDHSLL